jgi:hypothetical protein
MRHYGAKRCLLMVRAERFTCGDLAQAGSESVELHSVMLSEHDGLASVVIGVSHL